MDRFLSNASASGLRLASISAVVLVGFQPIARDRLARQRELVPRRSEPYRSGGLIQMHGRQERITHPEIFVHLLLRVRRGFSTLAYA